MLGFSPQIFVFYFSEEQMSFKVNRLLPLLHFDNIALVVLYEKKKRRKFLYEKLARVVLLSPPLKYYTFIFQSSSLVFKCSLYTILLINTFLFDDSLPNAVCFCVLQRVVYPKNIIFKLFTSNDIYIILISSTIGTGLRQ